MRDGPNDTVLAGAVVWRPQLSSFLGDQFLADQIPVLSGTLTVDTTQQVPESLTFTVPAWADGMSWIPLDPDHPLGKFGQTIDLQIEVVEPVTQLDWQIRIGQYLIQDWTYDDLAGTVEVECVGLLQIVADAAFTTPQVPRAGDTFESIITRLMPSGLGVNFDPALVDRAIPQSFQWDQDRLDALYDLADAWPARLRVDQYGTVQFLPILGDVPVAVVTLTDGKQGTLIGAPSSDTRDGVYNTVVVTGAQTDDAATAPVQSVAVVSGGPLDPSTYGSVVKFFTSPAAQTQAQCDAAATALLQQSARAALTRVAAVPPDPRLDVDDAVQLVQNPQGLNASTLTVGWIIGYQMPLTVQDGQMQVTVGTALWT